MAGGAGCWGARGPWQHTLAHDARQVQFHHDLSDDFHALWLDPRRVYSCACYQSPDLTLAQAQEAKPTTSAASCSCSRATGFWTLGRAGAACCCGRLNITGGCNRHHVVAQPACACAAAHPRARAGGRVRMQLADYRELHAPALDKIASVGMFEHVGRADGPLLQHRGAPAAPGRAGAEPWHHRRGVDNAQLGAGMGDFIEQYIFPGGELLHVSMVLGPGPRGPGDGDTENLRPHYARTLWAWSDGLEARLPAARGMLAAQAGAEQADKVLRAYRLYLAAVPGFERGWMALYQMLAIKPDGDPARGLYAAHNRARSPATTCMRTLVTFPIGLDHALQIQIPRHCRPHHARTPGAPDRDHHRQDPGTSGIVTAAQIPPPSLRWRPPSSPTRPSLRPRKTMNPPQKSATTWCACANAQRPSSRCAQAQWRQMWTWCGAYDLRAGGFATHTTRNAQCALRDEGAASPIHPPSAIRAGHAAICRCSGVRLQSTLAPEVFTTCAHFLCSLSMCLANSAGVAAPGIAPCASSRPSWRGGQ